MNRIGAGVRYGGGGGNEGGASSSPGSSEPARLPAYMVCGRESDTAVAQESFLALGTPLEFENTELNAARTECRTSFGLTTEPTLFAVTLGLTARIASGNSLESPFAQFTLHRGGTALDNVRMSSQLGRDGEYFPKELHMSLSALLTLDPAQPVSFYYAGAAPVTVRHVLFTMRAVNGILDDPISQ